MALPAIPAVASFAGKSLASLGIWKAGSGALSKIGPKLRGAADDAASWVRGNPRSAGKGLLAGGVGAGAWKTYSDTLDSVGIKDNQLQIAVGLGVLFTAIAAIGQLVDIEVGA